LFYEELRWRRLENAESVGGAENLGAFEVSFPWRLLDSSFPSFGNKAWDLRFSTSHQKAHGPNHAVFWTLSGLVRTITFALKTSIHPPRALVIIVSRKHPPIVTPAAIPPPHLWPFRLHEMRPPKAETHRTVESQSELDMLRFQSGAGGLAP